MTLIIKYQTDSGLSGYHKKKYIAKLIYIYILGWDVDFGHLEAVQLLQSPKYSEKQIVSLRRPILKNAMCSLSAQLCFQIHLIRDTWLALFF